MCLLVLGYRAHPAYSLVVAANRDEYYGRPTAPASFWTDRPDILAGRDLDQGGTWMGITTAGRFAALTNYRDPQSKRDHTRSRGLLVSEFLRGEASPREYLGRVLEERAQYNDFNLIAGDNEQLCYLSSRQARIELLSPGIHGLSNHLLNSDWPKVTRAKARLATAVAQPEVQLRQTLFSYLADRGTYADPELPNTGIGLEWERTLSAAFIVAPTYGTRASTLVLFRHDGSVEFEERGFAQAGTPTGVQRFQLSAARA